MKPKILYTLITLLALTSLAFSQQLVITEVFAKVHPSDSSQSDANGDGNWGNGNPDYRIEDEFIELANNSSGTLDISGYQIFEEDYPTVPRHTFPNPTILDPYEIIVVFGGGTPTGTFNDAIIQTSTSGDFDFDDNGENITIKDAAGNIYSTIYMISPTNHASVTLSPDINSPFHPNHETLSAYISYYGDYVSFSPGVFFNGDQSLPVELSEFTATYSNGKVILKWKTEAEINNAGFNIYRSVNSETDFTRVNPQMIAGAINSTTPNDYSYTDVKVKNNTTIYYKLEDVSTSGKTTRHGPVSIVIENQEASAKKFQLRPAYPNPFNPSTSINFMVAEQAQVKIDIYDMRGNLVNTLTDRNYSAGQYKVSWQAVDFNNNPVSAGVYIYHMATNTGFSKSAKMILIK